MRTASTLLALACATAAWAQTIDGRVFDQTGGIVAGARVVLLQDFNKLAETKSGEAGEFAFRDLKPGTYQVQVKHPWFQIFQELVMLEAGQNPRVYATLGVARAKDEVGILSDAAPPAAAPAPAAYTPGGQVAGLKRLSGRMPAWPEDAARRGISGAVVLNGTIKPDGSVSDIVVLESPDPILSKAALDAYGTWKFVPMKLNGQPVDTRHLLVLRFGRK